eukprot:356621-Chlamydomonas_euryale.AAC.1
MGKAVAGTGAGAGGGGAGGDGASHTPPRQPHPTTSATPHHASHTPPRQPHHTTPRQPRVVHTSYAVSYVIRHTHV